MSTPTVTPPDAAEPPAATDATATPGPAWLGELLEVLELRRRTLLIAVGALALAGILAAVLLPGFLPPRPAVGAAVGLAVVLLAVAVTFGLDSLDLKVRGPRHVRSSGGILAEHLSGAPRPAALGRLVETLGARASAGGRVLVGLSPLDADLDAEGWQDALATGLADAGLRVLTVDLQRPAERHPGVVEVAEGRTSLADAVTFDDERMVARLGPGADPVAALGGLRAVLARLPSDIDVLLVLLPPPSGGGVLGAASALDHVYVLAEVDRSARVDLIAALDAFDAVQATSQVLLVAPVDGSAATATAEPEDLTTAEPPDGGEAVDGEDVDAPEAILRATLGKPDAVAHDTAGEETASGEAAAEEPAAEEPLAPPATLAEGEPAPAGEVALPDEPAVDEPALADEPAADEPDPAHRPEPDPVLAEDEDAPELRLMMAEAALELSDLGELDVPSAAAGGAAVDTDTTPIEHARTEHVDIGAERSSAEADPEGYDAGEPGVVETEASDPHVDPVAHDGTAPRDEDEPPLQLDLDDPSVEDPAEGTPPVVLSEPFADEPDLPEDPARVEAALRGIGGLWSPAPARVPTAPRH